jgi:hypothetical protein
MAVAFYELRDDSSGWEKVGEVRNGTVEGNTALADKLDQVDVPLADEERLVELFDNPYFTAEKIDPD